MLSPRIPLCSTAALSCLLFSGAVFAQTHLEVQGGRSYMDNHGTDVFFVESVFRPYPLGKSRFTWSPDISIGYLRGRDIGRYRTMSPGVTNDVWIGAAGARLHYGGEGDWYRPLFFSFQVAGTHGRTEALSSGYQFVSTLGWQWKHFSLQIRHISNSGLHEPNRGETMGLAGFGFDL
ncbi:acyloxyacyl hydrolase [Dyella ginsengisoli]|uniref:acyloxyacyl hydrolase n=1 Tax=Dyella ginsengisoli TaxID=363848 RepID=UPI00036F8A6F|nr:acyloxyacyl hydrolase [Dyella ginsengisoli]